MPGLRSCVSYAGSASLASWVEVVVELMCFDLGHSVTTTSRKRVGSSEMRNAECGMRNEEFGMRNSEREQCNSALRIQHLRRPLTRGGSDLEVIVPVLAVPRFLSELVFGEEILQELDVGKFVR